jgi:hypothetical protein
MKFRKTAIALTAAGSLAVGSMAATQPAHAVAEWVVPAIIVAGIGGLAIGAATHAHAHYDPYAPAYYGPGPGYGPSGVVSVRANVGGQCWIENRRGGPVQVCRR